MSLSLSEIDAQIARERYDDLLREARLLRLIREGQAARQPVAHPERPRSLVARVLAALLVRRPVRA